MEDRRPERRHSVRHMSQNMKTDEGIRAAASVESTDAKDNMADGEEIHSETSIELPLTPAEAKKQRAKLKARERMRLYRLMKKSDPDYLKKQAERKRNQRKKMKNLITPEEQERLKELNRIRQRRYREKLKLKAEDDAEHGIEGPKKKTKRLTRAEHEKLKEKWRNDKRKQRANMSSQKKRRIKEYDRRRKTVSKDVKVAVSGHSSESSELSQEQPLQPSESAALTGSAIKQRAYRAKKVMPKTPEKFAQVVNHIIKNATPEKKKSLERAGIVGSSFQGSGNACVKSLKSTIAGLRKEHAHKWCILKRCLAVSLKSVKKARNYKKIAAELGLSYKFLRKYASKNEDVSDLTQRKRRSDALKTEVEKKVQEHYMTAASFIPDRKAVNKKTMESKKVLQQPVSGIYKEFKKKNPNVKISLSKFSKVRPKSVKTSNCQKLYQSRCEYCTNAKLKIDCVNKLCDSKKVPQCKIEDKYQLVAISMCQKEDEEEFHQKKCIRRECDKCGVNQLDSHLQTLIGVARNDVVKWGFWTSKQFSRKGKKPSTRKVLEEKQDTVEVLIDELKEDTKSLSQHLFVAAWQKNVFDVMSKDIPKDSCVMHLDFSENYSTFYQQEVSSAHWMKNLITVHPLVAFYKCPDCEGANPVMDVLVFLSDDNTHDHHAVQHFISRSISFLREERDVSFTKIYEFTDGCASQYKSRGPFVDLSFGYEDFGVKRERYYFGSCHGKGPSDAAGGVTKTAARMGVIRGEAIITDAESMYKYLKSKSTRQMQVDNICNHSRRNYFLVENINRKRHERAIQTTLKGTRKIHALRSMSPGLVCTRELACACGGCLADADCSNQSHVDQWSLRHLNLKEPHKKRVWRRGPRPRPSTGTDDESDTDSLVGGVSHGRSSDLLEDLSGGSVDLDEGGQSDGSADPIEGNLSGSEDLEEGGQSDGSTDLVEGGLSESIEKKGSQTDESTELVEEGLSESIDQKGGQPDRSTVPVHSGGHDGSVPSRFDYFHSLLSELRKAANYEELQVKCCRVQQQLALFAELQVDTTINIVDSKLKVDSLALDIMPVNKLYDSIYQQLLPVSIVGDGNCLPRCGSVVSFGNENFHEEVRARIVFEMCSGMDKYTDNNYLNRGMSFPTTEANNLFRTYTMFSECYTPGDRITAEVTRRIFEAEVMSTLKKDSYMGIWQMFALSSVLNCKILSVYPELGANVAQLVLNRTILPRESDSSDKVIAILWTSTRGDMNASNWIPNHFVPLLPISQYVEPEVNVESGEDQDRLDDSLFHSLMESLPSSDTSDIRIQEERGEPEQEESGEPEQEESGEPEQESGEPEQEELGEPEQVEPEELEQVEPGELDEQVKPGADFESEDDQDGLDDSLYHMLMKSLHSSSDTSDSRIQEDRGELEQLAPEELEHLQRGESKPEELEQLEPEDINQKPVCLEGEPRLEKPGIAQPARVASDTSDAKIQEERGELEQMEPGEEELFPDVEPGELEQVESVEVELEELNQKPVSLETGDPMHEKPGKAEPASVAYSVGSHVLVKHGTFCTLPAVVTGNEDQFLWVKFFSRCRGKLWTLTEEAYTILPNADIVRKLDPPDLVQVGGSRFKYSFNY